MPVSASPVAIAVTPTADAATSTGASLYALLPRPPPTPPSSQAGGYDNKDAGGLIGSFSVQTATSMFSHDTTSMHLDLHSFGKLEAIVWSLRYRGHDIL